MNAVSSSTKASCIYSGGADGMVCEIDPHSGNVIRKFKASTKAVSSLSVSPGVSLGDLVLPIGFFKYILTDFKVSVKTDRLQQHVLTYC